MKVYSVSPGIVNFSKNAKMWFFDIVGKTELWPTGQVLFRSDAIYPTANAAKQAMREKVASERKRHCIGV